MKPAEVRQLVLYLPWEGDDGRHEVGVHLCGGDDELHSKFNIIFHFKLTPILFFYIILQCHVPLRQRTQDCYFSIYNSISKRNLQK